MRCYFLRKNRIQSVEFLSAADDQGRIEEARKLFESKGKDVGADGFEVWERSRFVYRFPEQP